MEDNKKNCRNCPFNNEIEVNTKYNLDSPDMIKPLCEFCPFRKDNDEIVLIIPISLN